MNWSFVYTIKALFFSIIKSLVKVKFINKRIDRVKSGSGHNPKTAESPNNLIQHTADAGFTEEKQLTR